MLRRATSAASAAPPGTIEEERDVARRGATELLQEAEAALAERGEAAVLGDEAGDLLVGGVGGEGVAGFGEELGATEGGAPPVVGQHGGAGDLGELFVGAPGGVEVTFCEGDLGGDVGELGGVVFVGAREGGLRDGEGVAGGRGIGCAEAHLREVHGDVAAELIEGAGALDEIEGGGEGLGRGAEAGLGGGALGVQEEARPVVVEGGLRAGVEGGGEGGGLFVEGGALGGAAEIEEDEGLLREDVGAVADVVDARGVLAGGAVVGLRGAEVAGLVGDEGGVVAGVRLVLRGVEAGFGEGGEGGEDGARLLELAELDAEGVREGEAVGVEVGDAAGEVVEGDRARAAWWRLRGRRDRGGCARGGRRRARG